MLSKKAQNVEVVILTSLGTWGLPQMVQKFYAIKSEKAINKGMIISSVFALIVAGGCYFLGGFGRLFSDRVDVALEQFRLAIALRGCAYCILSSSLMWALHESVHELFEFFMGLFVFNIIHMYLAGAAGYGFYTSIFSHFLSDNMARYGSHLTLTGLDKTTFNFPAFMEHDFLPSMMAVAIKQSYGIIIWISLFATMTFFLLDIPAVRTNVRRVPIWAVAGIEYLAKLSGLRRRS